MRKVKIENNGTVNYRNVMECDKGAEYVLSLGKRVYLDCLREDFGAVITGVPEKVEFDAYIIKHCGKLELGYEVCPLQNYTEDQKVIVTVRLADDGTTG